MNGTCCSCKAQYTTADEDMRHQIECSPRPRLTLTPTAEQYIARQRARNRKNYWAGRNRVDTSQDGG